MDIKHSEILSSAEFFSSNFLSNQVAGEEVYNATASTIVWSSGSTREGEQIFCHRISALPDIRDDEGFISYISADFLTTNIGLSAGINITEINGNINMFQIYSRDHQLYQNWNNASSKFIVDLKLTETFKREHRIGNSYLTQSISAQNLRCLYAFPYDTSWSSNNTMVVDVTLPYVSCSYLGIYNATFFAVGITNYTSDNALASTEIPFEDLLKYIFGGFGGLVFLIIICYYLWKFRAAIKKGFLSMLEWIKSFFVSIWEKLTQSNSRRKRKEVLPTRNAEMEEYDIEKLNKELKDTEVAVNNGPSKNRYEEFLQSAESEEFRVYDIDGEDFIRLDIDDDDGRWPIQI